MPNCIPNININYTIANSLGLPNPIGGVSLPLLSHHVNQSYCTKYGGTQLFDIILPENNGVPCPLVIYIHGGGFLGNSKNSAYSSSNKKTAIAYLLSRGIAFASINYYKLNTTNETDGIIKSLSDCVTATQHFRNYNNQYRIDPNKIGLVGSSAGAGASLWIGFHPDMKDLNSNDLIMQQTTRVNAIAALNTQATYDLRKWHSAVFNSGLQEINVYNILGSSKLKSYCLVPSNITQVVDRRAAITSYLGSSVDYKGNTGINIDMLNLMTKNDPPFWVENDRPYWTVNGGMFLNEMNHHPLHSEALIDKALSYNGQGTLDVIAKIKNGTDNRVSKGYAGKKWYQWMADQLL
ncbi:MAG TPA: alpha/beta hydrolase [Saprospiraceae bacterium]|nr:alpha/beta hydrolase [Saprospiraceae bacterium]